MEERNQMKKRMRTSDRIVMAILLAGLVLATWTSGGTAEETGKKDTESNVQQLEEIVVKDEGGAPGLDFKQSETVIEVEDFPVIGPPGNITDYLKTQAIVDFRGETDLAPNSDTITMRGFESGRFVTALDGLTVQKTGGRKGTHIVDYSLLSAMPIEKIEIIAGPHSALYDSKSIGGVINVVTQAPERRDTYKPDLKLSTSYGSYNTQNHQARIQGAADLVTYGLSAQNNSTDGFLRNNDTEIENYSGQVGLVLPYEGFVSLSGTWSEIDREATVNNTGDFYDSEYPEVTDALFDPYQEPTWDKDAYAYRVNFMQKLPVGKLTAGAYLSKEDRDRAYFTYVDSKDPSKGLNYTSSYTLWRQEGAKIEDEYKWSDRQITTVGFDMAKLYDGDKDDQDDRVHKKALYFQHQWYILPSLDTKLGLRHEDVDIWVSGTAAIAGYGDWVHRRWSQAVPKSYTTWNMGDMAPWLRDTSLSLGVSRIWHAPDSHGEYNPQGRPAGVWLDPEHGMGYDFVLNRRLWRDISVAFDYSYYIIKDYIATNSSYAQYSGGSAGPLRYSDYKINLEEVRRNGVELNLGGHIVDNLSFYLTYAWQDFENQGDEPAGKTELDNQAEHRVSAGLRYELTEKTAMMLDYYYQSAEEIEVSELIDDSDPLNPVYDWRQVDNPSYNLFHLAFEQKLFDQMWYFQDARLQLYIKNLFDEEYYDASGYQSTDRTYGAVFSVDM